MEHAPILVESEGGYALASMPDTPTDLTSLMPFAAKCGIRITEAGPSEVRGELVWAADLCTTADVMHGGALMSLAESKTNFFRAMRKGTARATATPLHVGRTVVVVQTDVRDDDGKRIALVTQTQAVLT